MNQTLKTGDYFAAICPLFASMSLGEWNALLGIAGTLLGIAYLLWKWRREANGKSE